MLYGTVPGLTTSGQSNPWNRLTGQVPLSDIPTTGGPITVPITIQNGPGCVSNAVNFTIEPSCGCRTICGNVQEAENTTTNLPGVPVVLRYSTSAVKTSQLTNNNPPDAGNFVFTGLDNHVFYTVNPAPGLNQSSNPPFISTTVPSGFFNLLAARCLCRR